MAVGAGLAALLVIVGVVVVRPGGSTSGRSQPRESDGTSFSPVAVGAGGYVTGMSFSDDGATRVVRTDTFGGYRWESDRWQLNVSSESLPASVVEPGRGDGVSAVAVAPSDAAIAYMAYDDGLYRSEDGTRSWTKVLSGVATGANDDFRQWGSRLVVDPLDPDVVFYGTQLDGLYSTRDGGASWSQVSSSRLPAGLRLDLSDEGGRGSVQRPTTTTEDGTQVASAGISALAVDRSAGTVSGPAGRRSAVLYAASYGQGVFRSGDGGETWSRTGPDAIRAVQYLRVLENGDVIVTAHDDPTDINGNSDVWRLHDGTWTRTTPSQASNWRAVAGDPSRPGVVALMATGGQLALSGDHGETWRLLGRTVTSEDDVPWLAWALNGGNDYMSPGEIVFDPVEKGRLWFTEGTGVWYADPEPTDEVVDWVSQSRGIEQLVPTDVVVPPGGTPVLTAWDRAIFRSEDPDVYPERYGPVNAFGSAWSVDWSVSDPDYLVASVASHQWPSDPSTSGYSKDGGATWTAFPEIPGGSENAVTTFGFGTMAVGDPGNVVWVPSFGKRPHYTRDGGRTWRPVTLPGVSDYSQVNNKPYYVYRHVVAADKAAAGTFYLYVQGTGTFRSTDGAATWAQVSDEAAMEGADWSWNVSLKSVPGRRGELYMTPGQLEGTTSSPFLHSTDGGATWTEVDGLTGVTAFGFGKAFADRGPTVFAAGYLDGKYGVYRSTDEARSWSRLTDYPAGRTATIQSMDGDKDVAGRVHLSVTGGGWVYGDAGGAP